MSMRKRGGTLSPTWTLRHMRTLALILLSLSATCWAGDSMIDRRLREAITAMASNQVPGAPAPLERGVRLLLLTVRWRISSRT